MISGTKTTCTYLIAIGFGIIVLSSWPTEATTWSELSAWRITGYLVGLAVYLVGWCRYCWGMGYPWLLGLVGIFCPIGVVVLLWLPDRHPEKDEWWKEK
jgi:hypothetical protein